MIIRGLMIIIIREFREDLMRDVRRAKFWRGMNDYYICVCFVSVKDSLINKKRRRYPLSLTQ